MSDEELHRYKNLVTGYETDFIAAQCVICGHFGPVKRRSDINIPMVVKCSKCGQRFHRGCLPHHDCSEGDYQ